MGFEPRTFHRKLKEATYPALLHTALLNDQAKFLFFLILDSYRHSVIFDYYTGHLNAVERSVHLHGPFTTSGSELYLIIHRC